MAALHFGSNRNQNNSQNRPKKIVGRLRKTQLITTFGSGSIVDMPDYSVMIAGIDYWNTNGHTLHDATLEKMLSVKYFKEPPISESNDDEKSPDVPAFRFPYWHFCPKCYKLMYYKFFDGEDGLYCGSGHEKCSIVPSRFVVACTNGHIEDFPYVWWVHYGDFSKCPSEKRSGALRISFSEKTGGLDSIIIECSACEKKRSMAGCLERDALKGYKCNGRRPWLGEAKKYSSPENCTAQMRVLQRGSSNLYFSMTVSALTIPPWSSMIQQVLADKWDCVEHVFEDIKNEELLKLYFKNVFNKFLELKICTVIDLIEGAKKRLSDRFTENYSKQNILEDEYKVLSIGDYSKNDDIQFRIERTKVPDILKQYISAIVLAKRLREVLVLRGFRRIYPDQPDNSDEKFFGNNLTGDCVPLSGVECDWLPGTEMLGEGIFIQLREDKLQQWENSYSNEYNLMSERLMRSNVICENFSARYVLLHTLSHLLISQLSIECGYSGASIKERIYSTFPNSEKEMAGILLYTSASDSDGSLGGLVRKGLPVFFEMTFKNMLQKASWCSSDPICIDSHTQGFDSLNYAACHACTLLPETSCEMRNCLLDRKSVVGTLQNRESGYFGSLLD